MEKKIKVHQDKKWMLILGLGLVLVSIAGYQFFTSEKPYYLGFGFLLLAFAFRSYQKTKQYVCVSEKQISYNLSPPYFKSNKIELSNIKKIIVHLFEIEIIENDNQKTILDLNQVDDESLKEIKTTFDKLQLS